MIMHPSSSFLSALLLMMLPPSSSGRALITKTSSSHPRPNNLRWRRQQAATAVSDLLTETVFNSLAPNPTDPPYSYQGLIDAITSWNTANPTEQIFTSGTESQQRHELAAFLGHTLHESGDFVYPREISQCGTTTTDINGNTYCQPTGYFPGYGTRSDPYCSASHTSTSNPDGCDCQAVPEVIGFGYDANKLFFGRGPMQLSWNYNYIDAGAALGVDLCAEPDLVATNGQVAWGTAIWFWMQNTGSTGVTCHDAVINNGDFGGSLNTINGGLECLIPPAGASHAGSVVSRLDDYCRAVTALSAQSVLSLDGCDGLETRFSTCVSQNTCPNCVGIPTSPVTSAPSTSPTAMPTSSPNKPSASPTNGPTTNPTMPQPSTSPSKAPSKAPSQSPSESPSQAPSQAPTMAPSLSPTTAPPTTSPTQAPSRSPAPCQFYTNGQTCVNDCNEGEGTWPPTYPTLLECCTTHHSWSGAFEECMRYTDSPTANPTMSPSNGPTMSPSKEPTASPTEPIPTSSPSKSPSQAPSMAPSKSPSQSPTTAQPTSSPSQWPTKAPTPCKYYVDWSGTCINDCNEGEWPPPLHDTLDACCTTHYTWAGAYDICMGITNSPSKSPTSSSSTSPSTPMPSKSPSSAPSRAPQPCLYYADWSGTCVNDCNEGEWPPPLHNNLDACCTTHYTWAGAYDICMGITNSPSKSPTSSPSTSPSTPMPSKSPSSAPSHAPQPCLYYSDWSGTCVNDCNEGEWPPPLHNTLDACCTTHYTWAGAYDICMGITNSPSKSPTSSPSTSPSTPVPTTSPSSAPSRAPQPCLFYNNWSGTCVNDCNEGEWPPTLYLTLDACCREYTWAGAYDICMGSNNAA